MTLLELVESWGVRYGLERREVLELGEHVSAYVDAGMLARFGAMTVELAAKIRIRSPKEAARRVVAERLLADADFLGRKAPSPVLYEPPTVPRGTVAAAPPPPPTRVPRRHRCGICSVVGHTSRTCPGIRSR